MLVCSSHPRVPRLPPPVPGFLPGGPKRRLKMQRVSSPGWRSVCGAVGTGPPPRSSSSSVLLWPQPSLSWAIRVFPMGTVTSHCPRPGPAVGCAGPAAHLWLGPRRCGSASGSAWASVPPACSTTIPTAWPDPLPKGELHALVSTAGEDGPASSHGASGCSASGFVRSLPQSSSLHTLMERPNLLGQGVCQMWFLCFGTVLPSSREDNIYHSPSTNCSKRYAVSAPRENHARHLDSGEA